MSKKGETKVTVTVHGKPDMELFIKAAEQLARKAIELGRL